MVVLVHDRAEDVEVGSVAPLTQPIDDPYHLSDPLAALDPPDRDEAGFAVRPVSSVELGGYTTVGRTP